MKKYITSSTQETKTHPAIYIKDENGMLRMFLDVSGDGIVSIALDEAHPTCPLFLYKGSAFEPEGLPAILKVLTKKKLPDPLDEIPTIEISTKELVNPDALPHELQDKVKRWIKRNK